MYNHSHYVSLMNGACIQTVFKCSVRSFMCHSKVMLDACSLLHAAACELESGLMALNVYFANPLWT